MVLDCRSLWRLQRDEVAVTGQRSARSRSDSSFQCLLARSLRSKETSFWFIGTWTGSRSFSSSLVNYFSRQLCYILSFFCWLASWTWTREDKAEDFGGLQGERIEGTKFWGSSWWRIFMQHSIFSKRRWGVARKLQSSKREWGISRK